MSIFHETNRFIEDYTVGGVVVKGLIDKEEGIKHDQGKPRMDLIPPEMLEEVAKVLTFGANKYSDRNWEKGLDWGRVYGALQRHLNSWWGNTNGGIDEETGLSHLSHALCCLSFLVAYEKRGTGTDTRYKLDERN